MGKVTTRDGTEILDTDREEGRPVVAAMFGPDGQRVLALIIRIPSLTADQVDQVTSAWKRGDPIGRAYAWAQLNRAATEEERHRILTAAALARREALETARLLDPGGLGVLGRRLRRRRGGGGRRRLGPAYDTLVAPFAEVMPALHRPGTRQRHGACRSPPSRPGRSRVSIPEIFGRARNTCRTKHVSVPRKRLRRSLAADPGA